jgi:hypothetical protein
MLKLRKMGATPQRDGKTQAIAPQIPRGLETPV